MSILKNILTISLFLLFFRSVGTKVWSIYGGYDTRFEAMKAADDYDGQGGPYEFKVVCLDAEEV